MTDRGRPGVVSFGGKSWEADAPVSIDDASRDPREPWRPAVEMPADDRGRPRRRP